MRIPYVPTPPPTATSSDAAIVTRIEARRAPRPLELLDLALLHSFPVADGWNSFLGAIRTKTSLGDDLREIAICRATFCNKAWYELDFHGPLASKAGVSPAGLKVVKQDVLEGMDRPEGLDERQWAVLLYADELTRSAKITDETFALVRKIFNNQEVVEITATVSTIIRHLLEDILI